MELKQSLQKLLLLTILAAFFTCTASAQYSPKHYILPDKRIITPDQLDSVIKSWGGTERVQFSHNAEDDINKVMHLEYLTDEMLKEREEAYLKRMQLIQSMINHEGPAWEATDLTGHKISSAQLRGKVVVMNFWFTTCSPCIVEMPRLNELVKSYDQKDVCFIAFSFNKPEDISLFLKTRPFNFIQVPESREVNKLFGVASYPTSIVIDRKGVIRMISPSDPEIKTKLAKAIDSAINPVD